MKIECTTTFLDGTDRFEAGDTRTVDDERGARFVAAGWARDMAGVAQAGDPAPAAVDMTIHKSTMGQEVHHG